MSTLYRYAAYAAEGGRPGDPILVKKDFKERLKTAPETIYVRAYPDNYIVEEPYEGLLSDAPHDLTLIIEGRRKAPPPSREAIMMGIADFDAQEVAFQAYLAWSDRAKRWRISM